MGLIPKKIWYTCEEDNKSFPIREDDLQKYRIKVF